MASEAKLKQMLAKAGRQVDKATRELEAAYDYRWSLFERLERHYGWTSATLSEFERENGE